MPTQHSVPEILLARSHQGKHHEIVVASFLFRGKQYDLEYDVLKMVREDDSVESLRDRILADFHQQIQKVEHAEEWCRRIAGTDASFTSYDSEEGVSVHVEELSPTLFSWRYRWRNFVVLLRVQLRDLQYLAYFDKAGLSVAGRALISSTTMGEIHRKELEMDAPLPVIEAFLASLPQKANRDEKVEKFLATCVRSAGLGPY